MISISPKSSKALRAIEQQETKGINATKEQIEMARAYVNRLDTLKVKKPEPILEKDLIDWAMMFCKLTYKNGDGDPILAAERHAKVMRDLNIAMELSTSDKSEAVH